MLGDLIGAGGLVAQETGQSAVVIFGPLEHVGRGQINFGFGISGGANGALEEPISMDELA